MKLKLCLVLIMVVTVGLASPLERVSSTYEDFMDIFRENGCKACKTGVGWVNKYLLGNIAAQLINLGLGLYCTSQHLKWTQCFKASNGWSPPVFEGLRKILNPEYFWEITTGACEKENFREIRLNQEVKRIISDKPDFIKDNKYINKLYDQIDEDRRAGKQRKNMTLYHITDVHINADYKEGTNNKCNSFVCCTEESGVATKDKDRAGKWGDYLCDTNPRVIDQLQTAVGKTGMPDFVAWTGDSTGHQIHNNPFITTKATKQVTLILERIFEKSVVFPIHGNHEFAPFNIQDMSKKNSEEVELIADAWKDWMTPEVYQEFIHHSYFSYDAKTHPKASEEFKRKMDKVRIISINTQNCYTFNFKLIGEYNDPGQEFNWLENLLRQMEKDGEIAILIGHIPPGNLDCTQEFGMRMRALHDRFQHIIRLNLFGHTHYEEFEVHRGISDDLPIGTNHVSPSITTFVDQNPSFRVIILDEETLLPIEIQTYTMYLDKANKNDKDAKFVLDHEYTKQFGLKDLSPSSMLILSNKLRNYDDHATNYMINRLGGSPKAHYNMKKGCNERWRRIIFCDTAFNDHGSKRACKKWADLDSIEMATYIFDFVYPSWVKRIE